MTQMMTFFFFETIAWDSPLHLRIARIAVSSLLGWFKFRISWYLAGYSLCSHHEGIIAFDDSVVTSSTAPLNYIMPSCCMMWQPKISLEEQEETRRWISRERVRERERKYTMKTINKNNVLAYKISCFSTRSFSNSIKKCFLFWCSPEWVQPVSFNIQT